MALVTRMVLAGTLVMLISMTFRIPYGAYGAIYAMTLSRESPQATITATRTIIIAFAFATADVLLGAMFFLHDPMLRLLWVIVTFFMMFYALSAMTNYSAAARFGYLVVITTPLWDQHTPANVRVESTLWAVGAISAASVITSLLELIFAELRPGDDVLRSLAERLTSVEKLLTCYVADRPVDKATEKEITRLGLVGTSRLRRLLGRSTYSPRYREQMGAVVALIGRLVDMAASLTYLNVQVSDEDRKRFRSLAENIAKIRTDLLGGRLPRLVEIDSEKETSSAIPLLGEMERTTSLISEVFTGSQSLSAYAPSPSGNESSSALFVPDALSNSEHVKFGLKGCLAASLCYITYSALFWPGINTAVTTCLLTALTTIGASRQKQILRIAGALVGGVVIGIGAELFILPYLDSIGGFTILFLVVSTAAAWVSTSSPRLSYFGAQVIVAFYLINLEEFKVQTSLTLARDRVAGVVFGLLMMWLIFDQLWGAPAAVEIKRTLISILRLLAQLTREPVSRDRKVTIERSYSLRETINKNFDKVRALSDGVLFEFGSSRQQNLALRNHIREWQPQLRALFVIRTTLLKYRLQLPGFELPEPIRMAQQAFDDRLAQMLEGMADRMDGKAAERKDSVDGSLEGLENTVRVCCSDEQQGLTAHLQTFLPLSRRMENLTTSLAKEI
jgi:multidrug resistance protein MdtO